ncbi:dATP/dGTP diphosphohydrolase domain-containing protein [Aurantimonas coralicida]|uniref:dATP/dGTP diphosphohydrolase domain-containing protein n=1 Tax=Aurantimonas coralicida TaxID=182270 RepID=UPI0004175EE0|nr:dATP/dGTP diphosphohydrolase domain-containing protein [Aurantimonas coralicida]
MSDENPKALVGRQKAPLTHVVPATSLAWLAEAHLDGAEKYGRLNWREKKIALTDYIDAIQRHIDAIKEGEDHAGDSGLLHLAHIMAGASIVIDARACGCLIDDRVFPRADALEASKVEILEARRGRHERKAAA